jgi:predicted phosphoadenosine phosphosulfate sulfurtransferase
MLAEGRTPTAAKARPLDTDVYTLALERMAYILDSYDQVAVSFSGGKDSTAVLNVALEVAHSDPRYERHLPLRVVHYDEEAIPYQTEEYVRRVAQRPDVALEWYCLPVKHRNACSRRSPFWWPWAPEAEDLWCRPMPPEAITELDGFPAWPAEARLSIPDANGLLAPPRSGNVAMLMGIRAQESMTRRRALLVGSTSRDKNYLVKYDDGTSAGNLWKAYPVYDWTTEDVWTAPAKLGWDYNRAYDVQEMAGVGHHAQRCSPAFGEEPIQKLHLYASCFPEVWQKMTARVPGVGAAVRYANTELYAQHGRPQKPADMSWPEFIAHYLGQHPPEVAQAVAQQLADMTRTHYRKASHPIPEDIPHPRSGLRWTFILRVAMRGNLKGRNQPAYALNPDPADYPRQWRKYADELAAIIAAGRFGELGHPGPPPADPYALIPPEYRQGGGHGDDGTAGAAVGPEPGAARGRGLELEPAGVGGPAA